jgi:hypothetical protein
MRNATIRLPDNERFTAEWEFYQGGHRQSAENFQYTRVR